MQICYTSRNTKKCLDSAETVLGRLTLSDKEPYDNELDTILIWDKALYKLTDIPKSLLQRMFRIADPIHSDETGNYYYHFDLVDALKYTVDDISRQHYSEQIYRIEYLETTFHRYSEYVSNTDKKKWGKL